MSNTKIDFLYLSEKDMIDAGVKDMAACIDAIEEMFVLLKKGDFRMGGANGNSHGLMVFFPETSEFPNMPLDSPDRRFVSMPAYLGGKFDMAGCKWYGSNIANKEKGLPRSILMVTLSDKDTGAPVCHMSANLLSAYRTGAVPGVGYKYFAKDDAKVLGLIGPGVMSKTSLAAAMATRNIEVVKVNGRTTTSKSTVEFVEFVKKEYPNVKEVYAVETIEEAVRDSDIVSIATSTQVGDPTNYPYVKEEWIKKGAIISCPASARFDDDFLLKRARNVADCYNLYVSYEEEAPFPAYNSIPMPAVRCMNMMEEGLMEKDELIDLADIIMGKVPVRNHPDDIVIYSVGGMPVEDVAWGTTVYRNAIEKGIGTKLNLWDEPDMA